MFLSLVRVCTITICVILFPLSTHAATLYWVGNDGASTNVATNWKTTDPASCGGGNSLSVPGAIDTIIFDRDCDNGAVIQNSPSVTTTIFQNGYAGTVSMNTDFTSTTFTQSGGVIRLNGQNFSTRIVTINTGTTFTAGTGTLTLTGGSSTIDVDSTLTLNNLTINGTTATAKTIANSDTLIVTGTLTLTDGLLSQTTIPAAGTILAQGNVVEASTFDGGTARIEVAGSGDQTFTGNATRTAGFLPLVKINKTTGTLTLSGTIRTASNWNFSGGTIAFTNSTVVFANGSPTIAGTQSFSNLIFDQASTSPRTYTIKTGDTLTVLGTLTLDNSNDTSSAATITLTAGTIRAKGNINVPDNVMNHTGTTTIIVDGTADQLFSGNAVNRKGGLPPLSIEKPSGTLTLSGTIRTAKDWTYRSGTINASTNASTVVFAGVQTISGSMLFYNLIFTGSNLMHTIGISGTPPTVGGTLTLSDGAINGGTVEADAGVSTTAAFDGGNGTLLLAGSATRTITLTESGSLPGLTLSAANVTVDAPATGNTFIRGPFNQTAGTFSGHGSNVYITGDVHLAGGIFTAPTGNLNINGVMTSTAGTFTPAGGTVIVSTSGSTLTPPGSLSNLTLREGLIGYWPFDETSGTVATDASGFGQNGTYVGTPTFSADHPAPLLFTDAGSLNFTGADYVDMGDISGTESAFTASMWIKTSSTFGMFMSKDIDNSLIQPQHQWNFSIYQSLPELNVTPPGNAINTRRRSTVTVDDDQWHHLVAVYDGPRGIMHIYTDGVLTDGGLDVGGVVPPYAMDTNRSFQIGSFISSTGNQGTFYTGLMDEARLYNRPLSAAEITALYGGAQFTQSTYTLGAALTVGNTLSLNRVILDPSVSCYTISDGIVVNNGSTINSCSGSSSSSSTAAASSAAPVSAPTGGGRGGGTGLARAVAAAEQRQEQETQASNEEAGTPSTTPAETPSNNDTPATPTASDHLTATTAEGQTVTYVDVPASSWFTQYVSLLIEKGIAEGYKDEAGNLTGEFGIAQSVTRAEILKMALEVAGEADDLPSRAPRNASAKGEWSAGYVREAEDRKLSLFLRNPNVNAAATRGEVVQMVVEVLGLSTNKSALTFTDVPSSNPYSAAIATAAAKGLISGDLDDNGNPLHHFRPTDAINRAEVAKIIALAAGLPH